VTPNDIGILTIAHGTVETLDELPPFLTQIRRGHPAPPALVAEVRRRYEVIGGRSPLNDICRTLTQRLGERLGAKAAFAGRLWEPLPEKVLPDLLKDGVKRVVVLPLAQHSAPIYVGRVREAAAAYPEVTVLGPSNWGQEPGLTRAFAASLVETLAAIPSAERATTRVLFTAHSLPLAVLRGGDPYEREVRASAEAVAACVREQDPAMPVHEVIFQSQGMGGGEWLGPDVQSTLERLSHEGVKRVVFAPIGFLADHVEILYDLDVEARGWAEARGLTSVRTASLNASPALVETLATLAERVWTDGAA
jgi:ferrochelatase